MTLTELLLTSFPGHDWKRLRAGVFKVSSCSFYCLQSHPAGQNYSVFGRKQNRLLFSTGWINPCTQMNEEELIVTPLLPAAGPLYWTWSPVSLSMALWPTEQDGLTFVIPALIKRVLRVAEEKTVMGIKPLCNRSFLQTRIPDLWDLRCPEFSMAPSLKCRETSGGKGHIQMFWSKIIVQS